MSNDAGAIVGVNLYYLEKIVAEKYSLADGLNLAHLLRSFRLKLGSQFTKLRWYF